MLAFNGGHVYPRLFHCTVPLEFYPSTEPITYVDPFCSWADAERYWRGGVYRGGTPPNMLFIGGDLGGLEILLSLRPADFGQIFCWLHSTNIWGTDGNNRLWLQAPSFEAFVESLYDDSDGSDYNSWRLPIYDKLAKPLAF